MKRVVISEEYRESEIHPKDLLDEYLDITKNEIEGCLDTWKLLDVSCPACNSNQKNKSFEKFGMNYYECQECKTLFVNPRPSEKDISNFYKKSKAIEFFNNRLYKETLYGRKKMIFNPRAEWIVSVTENYFQKPETYIDIRTKYVELIEEIDNLNKFENKVVIDPVVEMDSYGINKSNTTILRKSYEEISSKDLTANAISAFEVLDRISSPGSFMNKIRDMLTQNGMLFLTIPTISGFDLRVLWGNSKSIYPLDHINLFSTEGIEKLLNNSGFEIIEMSSPGLLDLKIVKNMMQENPNLEISKFISYLIENRDESAHQAFQDFLQRFNLSSHLRIAAQKI